MIIRSEKSKLIAVLGSIVFAFCLFLCFILVSIGWFTYFSPDQDVGLFLPLLFTGLPFLLITAFILMVIIHHRDEVKYVDIDDSRFILYYNKKKQIEISYDDIVEIKKAKYGDFDIYTNQDFEICKEKGLIPQSALDKKIQKMIIEKRPEKFIE